MQSNTKKKNLLILVIVVIFAILFLCCFVPFVISAMGGTEKLQEIDKDVQEKSDEIKEKTKEVNGEVENDTLDISYKNAVLGLSKYMEFERSTKADGTPRYYGVNNETLTKVEVIGEDDVQRMTYWFSLPAGMSRQEAERYTDVLAEIQAFILNNHFEDDEAKEVNKFINESIKTQGEKEKVFGEKNVIVNASGTNYTVYIQPSYQD